VSRRQRTVVLAQAAAMFLIGFDSTATFVLVTPLEDGLDITITTVQWVITVYMLSLATVVVAAGRLADMHGRRRVLLGGLATFGTASLLSAIAPNGVWLIVARAIQGVGAGLIIPAAMGIANMAVPPARRATAIGFVVGGIALGDALGPGLGGLLNHLGSWRLVFLASVPATAAVAWLTRRFVVADEAPGSEQHINIRGALLIAIAVGVFLFGVEHAKDWGWTSTEMVGVLAISIALAAAFVLNERRARGPLVPRAIERNRQFFVVTCIGSAALAVLVSVLFFLPQFFDKFYDYTTLESGLALMPLTLAYGVTSPIAGRFYERAGPRVVICVGLLLQAAGCLGLAALDPGDGYLAAVPWLLVFGAGAGVSLAASSAGVIGAVDEALSSAASGLFVMLRTVAAAVGLGVATTIYVTHGINVLSEKAARAGTPLTSDEAVALQGLPAGTRAAEQTLLSLPASTARHVLAAVDPAYLGGYHAAMLFIAGLALAAVVATLVLIRRPSGRG
jgi:EmrB/QacA subfamily drug resistance transporter